QRAVLLQHSPAAAAGRIALIVALPGELHTRPPVPLHLATVHLPLDGDEAETARRLVLGELDERGCYEVQGIAVPQLCLRDPPPASDAHPRSSSLQPLNGRRGPWLRGGLSRRTSRQSSPRKTLSPHGSDGAMPGSSACAGVGVPGGRQARTVLS